MSSGSAALQEAERGNEVSGKRTPCPLYGCKRVYADLSALESHIKDHEIPAQSLPGKVLLCSTVGCSGSFPNMQKLMEHMRHHHKPNIFFLCENCRTKLRSYRGLLTHLHTCSKVPRGKSKPTELMPPQPPVVTNPNMTPMAIKPSPSQLDAASKQQQLPCQIPNPEGSFPDAVPQTDSVIPPLFGPPCFINHETSSSHVAPTHRTEAAPQPQTRNQASGLSPSLCLDGQTIGPDPQGQHQPQTMTPEPLPLSPLSAPHSPPVFAAVWKKNHGTAGSRRILWEHTKGRYTCVQCGHAVTNRKDMNHHINTQHSGNKPTEDSGSVEAGGLFN